MTGLQIVFSIPGRLRILVPALGTLRGERLVRGLEGVVAAWPGISRSQAGRCSGLLLICYDSRVWDPERLCDAVNDLCLDPGPDSSLVLPAHSDHDDHDGHSHSSMDVRGYVVRLWIGGLVLAGIAIKKLVLGSGGLTTSPVGWIVGAVTTIVTGLPFFKGGLRSLQQDAPPTTDSLISVATLSSLALQESVTAIIVLWLLNLGEYLQALTLQRTRTAIEELMSVTDALVWLVVGADPLTGEGGDENRVGMEELQPGGVLAVYTGDKIPADGCIVRGQATINEAPITGESMPVYKGVGHHVFAGTIVQAGAARILAQKVGQDTVVGRLIARVEQAQELRAPIQTLGDRFARRFVPVSFALSLLTWVLTRDLRRSLTMLVVACPCASGLATPTAVSASIGNAARRGVLIKGGTHLEQVGRIDTVVFDKTGTLTIGQPRVSHVLSLTEAFTAEEILMMAGSGEMHSQHPLALAVLQHLSEQELAIPPHEECEVLVGRGMRADLSGHQVLVGSRRLLEEFRVEVSAGAGATAATFGPRGETVLFVAHNGKLVGLLGIADIIREEATGALARLYRLGIRHIYMLTGDSADVAEKVAIQLELPPGNVKAELFPEDKFEIVKQLMADGRVVAMVGDGINDAPALALANVGIAMGAGGSEVAIEAADIALASSDIRRIGDVVALGRQALTVIGQNYGMAIGVNGGGVVIGMLGWLSPILAAVLHNLSTILVIINSSRLIHYDPTRRGGPDAA